MLIIQQRQAGGRGTPDELRAREKASRYRLAGRGQRNEAEALKARLDSIKASLAVNRVAGESRAHASPWDAAGDEICARFCFRAAVDNKWTLLELHRRSRQPGNRVPQR